MNINHVTTHLTEAEIPFQKLDFYYQKHDARVWTLRIFPESLNIVVFCKVNHVEYNTVTYDILYSGGCIAGIGEDFFLDKIHQLVGF